MMQEDRRYLGLMENKLLRATLGSEVPEAKEANIRKKLADLEKEIEQGTWLEPLKERIDRLNFEVEERDRTIIAYVVIK